MFPLPGDGSARFKPVFVDDVAEAIEACITEGASFGKLLELTGPEEYTMKNFVKISLDNGGYDNAKIVSLPYLTEAAAWFFERLPYSDPLLTKDEVIRWQEDEISFGEQDGFKLLNLKTIPFSREAAYLAFKYKNLFEAE